jgi:hypothetical protein
MAFVDGTLDNGKLNAVLRLAATLGVKADFVRDIANVAQGRLRDATAHMIRANLESLTGKAWTDKPWATDDDAMGWFLCAQRGCRRRQRRARPAGILARLGARREDEGRLV